MITSYSMIIYLILVSLNNSFFFFNDTATTEIYTLSLHDALPILPERDRLQARPQPRGRWRHDASRLARQIDSHRPAEPEGANIMEELRFAQPRAHLRRADVARVLDDFSHRLPSVPPPAGIAEDDPSRCQQRPAAEEALSRRHDA